VDGSDARRATSAAPFLMVGGAVLILIGSLVAWYRLRVILASIGASRSVTITGVRTNPGKIFLVAALVVAGLGAAAWSSGNASTKRMLAVIGAVAAGCVGVVAVYDALTPKSQVIDAAARDLGAGGGFVFRRIIEGLFDRGIIKIDVQPGLWVVVAGAALALVGSLVAAVTARSLGADAPAFSPPVPAGAWSSGIATATPAGAPISPEPASPAPSQPSAPLAAPAGPPEPPAGPMAEDADPAPDD
jgi:hypothetical protein